MPALKKDPGSATNIHTLLGPESSFEGTLVFNGGQVRIDGQFKGEIKAESTLIVGESARIDANIHVGSVIITGQVVGNITAKNAVGIEKPARVKGTIHTPELMIEKGVIFEGDCHMEQAAAGGTPNGKLKLMPKKDANTPPEEKKTP